LTFGNTIGGTATGAGNVISGNTGPGLYLYDSNLNTIQGNIIGLNATGTAAVANTSYGVSVAGANNTIGGTDPGAANTISGNISDGLVLGNAGSFVGANGAPSGLVSWWKADSNNASGTTALDVTGTNDATLVNGATYAAGKSGTAFSFDGANDYISIPDSASLRPSTLTLSAWVNPTSTASYNSIISKGSTGIGGLGVYGNSYQLYLTNGKLSYLLSLGAANNHYYELGPTIPTGQWTHVAMTYDGSTMKLFMNGAQVYSMAASGSILYDDAPVTIGSDTTSGDSSTLLFNGLIDEPGLFNRALTAQEIANIYDSGGTTLSGNGGNIVQGNRIGVASGSSTAIANSGNGISIISAGNLIGGTAAGAGNIIANNTGDGISITSAETNPTNVGNTLLGNSIYANGSTSLTLGIDLGTDGVNANDSNDSDRGVNFGQNFPTISAVNYSGGNATVTYSLDAPAGTYRVEFFGNTSADASGYGEGQTYLGSANITTTGGATSGTVTLTGVSTNTVIAATATEDMGSGLFGNTSEFGLTSSPMVTISGKIFDDVNFGGGAGRDYTTANSEAIASGFTTGAIGRSGATVELYDSAGNYVTSTTTTADGSYSFDVMSGTNYSVRVVNNTVSSVRGAGGLGVQTFRTDVNDGSSASQVTDHVGGDTPNEIDAAANSGAQTLTALDTQAGLDVQSVASITAISGNVTNVDFGFNFDTIINTNDAGQGSLRQFILNSNALANTNLAQSGQTTGKEVSIFMIADGQAHAGLNTGYANLLTGTIGTDARAVITLASALPTITGANSANTVIDATTQTTNVGNSNAGTVGVGGASSMTVGVGVDGIAGTGDEQVLSAFARPEVEVNGNGIASTMLLVTANNFTAKGLSWWGHGGVSTSGLSLSGSTSGHLIQDNLFGANALGTAQAQVTTGQNQFLNITSGVTGTTVFHNYVTAASKAGSLIGIYPNIGSTNITLDSNEFTGTMNYGTPFYASNSTATRNYFHNLTSHSVITANVAFTNQTFEHNTFANTADGLNLQTTASGVVRNNLITGITGNDLAVNLGYNGQTVTVSKNSIYGNTGLGINLALVASANDGSVSASQPNYGIDSPVITNASLVGSTLTVTGYIGTAAGDTDFANATVELFKAAADGSGFGEGQTYLGSITGSVTDGNFTGSIALPGGVSLSTGDVLTSTATIAAYGTSEFGGNATLRSISGTVFEDIAGNLLVGEAIGDTNNPGVSGVTVTLWKDGGDGVASGIDDVLVGTTTTTIGGGYNFTIDTGTYWTVIDSRTIVSSTALNATFTNADTWAEQSYGVAGALHSTGFQPVSGALHGGRNIETSDDAATLSTSEHVTRVIVSSSNVTNIDSGFSFTTITRTGDGDDDGSANRSMQGSLRQFIQNSNALAGIQTSAFKLQTSDSNYSNTGGGEYTIRPTSALPTITDTITFDATTQAGYVSSQIVELDGRTAGVGGVDGLKLGSGSSGSTIRGFVINRFSGDGIQVDSSNNAVVGNLIGLRAEASPVVGSAVGWWQAENNANDSTGMSNGTLNGGATFAAGRVGQSFDLDGTDDYVEIANSPALSSQTQTWEGWVRADRAGAYETLATTVPTSGEGLVFKRRNDGTLWFAIGNTGGGEIAMSSTSMATGQWYHIAGTYDGSSLKLYINGVLESTVASTRVLSTTQPLRLGRDGTPVEFFDGQIDEFTVYSRALSATEIAATYAAGNTGQTVEKSPLVASFRMDGLTTDAIDGRSMTVNGATLTNSGRVGSAYDFDGADDFISTSYAAEMAPKNAVTVSTWFQADVAKQALLAGTWGSSGTGTGSYTLWQQSDGKIAFSLSDTGSTNNAIISSTLTPGSWHHAVGTFDGDIMRLYIDGTEVSSYDTAFTSIFDNGLPFQIGGESATGFFDGKIDEVSLFNRALTAGEITDLYNTFAGTANVLGNGAAGVNVNSGSNNVVGGTTATDRNIVSNNVNGVSVGSGVGATTIHGNYIGTDVTGTLDFGNSQRGVYVTSPSGAVTIGGTTTGARNVISGNNSYGIEITGGSGHLIQGNYIGTDVSGTLDLGNTNAGIRLSSGSTGTLVGGATANAGNVISGNDSYGINLNSDGNTIQGNLIGLTASGDTALSNTFGIAVWGANNVIGGTTSAARNIISGNTNAGIYFAGASGNSVQGNYIGTDISGTVAIGNGTNGVELVFGASNTIVGGSIAGAGNLISGNSGGSGVYLNGSSINNVTIAGNTIGLNAEGTAALGNQYGVRINGAYGNVVGGSAAGSKNLISGNSLDGVRIENSTGIPAETVAWWKAENSANDAIGSNNGTLVNGANYADGTFGRAFSLDGVDDAVAIADSAALQFGSGSFTVEAWVNVSAFTGWDTVITKRNEGTNYNGFWIGRDIGSGHWKAGVTSGGNVSILSNSAATTGNATHLMMVIDRGSSLLRFYVNGVEQATADISTIGSLNSTSALMIGDVVGGGQALNGVIDEAAIYTRALSAAEAAAAHRNGGATKLGNRVEGNFIGTDAAGTGAIANGSDGVEINAASGQVIGGQTAAHRNIISGNTGDGVKLVGASTQQTHVLGNYIGTNAAGDAAIGNGGSGVELSTSATKNVIGGVIAGARNVLSGNGDGGIYISNSTANTVQGNYIGLDAAGNSAIANTYYGIGLEASGSNNLIGGDIEGARNVISGNARGLSFHTSSNNNTVQGNYFGTNAAGDTAVGGDFGVFIGYSGGNLIGGTSPNAGNVISGHSNSGVVFYATSGTANVVQGNTIGLNATGTAALGNANYGVYSYSGSGTNLVGGTAAGTANTISGNGIGVAIGDTATDLTILGNSIYGNTARGIDIDGNGLTANDAGDADTGANDRQNFPVIVSTVITGGQTIIAGTLNSEANKTYRIELFSNSAADASGYGEGETYLGFVNVTTDGSGNASFSYTHGSVLAGLISGTATEDLGGGSFGSTSEFAQTTSSIYTISGTVFEDIYADGAGSEAIGHANNPVRSGVTVKLYADGGDGLADGGDDIYMTSTTTDGSGNYTFNVDNGTFWTVVDSKTITSSIALNGGFTSGDTWAEQTYGALGSVLFDGSNYSYQTSTGETFGGQRVNRSDDASAR
jgi:parallel beta-helix repeat protein